MFCGRYTDRTVLVTGAATGIGYALACSFVRASAARVIITGRRAEVLSHAAEALKQEIVPDSGTEIIPLRNDVSDATAVNEMWQSAASIAANLPTLDLFGQDGGALWKEFDANVRGTLQMTERFYRQQASKRKYLIYVATAASHDFNLAANHLGYPLTKHTAQLALQLIARDVKADDMQIISFHPGAVLGESAKGKGHTEGSLPWDDADLAGGFSVWAVSPEATFLHGRFVWAGWDVDALQKGDIRKRIDEDEEYLRIGVNGLCRI
ncbi:NAD(P)-binding protein [Xylariaceae sp. FL0255]|nr:NAD(P)-binding protein [Xylariaceae sp. FL0255]